MEENPQITEFEKPKPQQTTIEEDPIISRPRLIENPLDKNAIPQDGILVRIEKVVKVNTRFGERYILKTSAGDTWFPKRELYKMADKWGSNSANWRGKQIKLRTENIIVRNQLKKTWVVDFV